LRIYLGSQIVAINFVASHTERQRMHARGTRTDAMAHELYLARDFACGV